MRKLMSLLLVGILAVCAVLPAAAESHPLMYKVTDADGHIVYLLGTMHIVANDTFPIAGLDDILGAVDTVYFELDEAAMDQLTHPETLQEAAPEPEMVEDNGLSDETIELIAQFLLDNSGYDHVNRDALRQLPVTVLSQMIQSVAMAGVAAELSPISVDVYVFSLAREMGLKILGVEDLPGQLSTYANDSAAYMTQGKEGAEGEAAAEATLLSLLGTVGELPEQLRMVNTAYSAGDKDALLACLAGEDTRAESDGARNELFTSSVLQTLKDGGSALYAIGVYHLIAEDGLVNTLTAAGCTVEEIRNELSE